MSDPIANPTAVPAKSATTVTTALSLSPEDSELEVGESVLMQASGGTPPYSFRILLGSGSLGSNQDGSVYYTTASKSELAGIEVADSTGTRLVALVTSYPVLAIQASSSQVTEGGTIKFTAEGGLPPYTYQVEPITMGSVSASGDAGGTFTALGAGAAFITVEDSKQHTAQLGISVHGVVAISPATPSISAGGSLTFSASGGFSPYSFALISGSGALNGVTGEFKAPNVPGTAVIQAIDSRGNTASTVAHVVANTALTITPSDLTTAPGQSQIFSATGGVSPYVYDVVYGVGTVTTGGLYSAGNTVGSAAVRVTDHLGATALASVVVASPVTLAPESVSISTDETATFIASAGVPPYLYDIALGGVVGTINEHSGLFSPDGAGTATVRVTDSLGGVATASIQVYRALAIAPAAPTVSLDGSVSYSATGGTAPYTYSIVSGGGSISSGTYTAPSVEGTAVVRVRDSAGHHSDSTVTIGTNPFSIVVTGGAFLAVNNSREIRGSGGTLPYTFSIISGETLGSLSACATPSDDCSRFTAASSIGGLLQGQVGLRAQDKDGTVLETSLLINPALALSPATLSLGVGQSFTLQASGGVEPYSYSLGEGARGTLSGNVYTAPPSGGGPYLVNVGDSMGNTASASITISPSGAFKGIDSIDAITGTTLRLNWTSQANAAKYIVYRMSGQTPIFVADVAAPASSYTVTGLGPSTSYTYWVQMLDSLGNRDANVEYVTASTATVTVSHQGWSDVQALGEKSPASQGSDVGSAGIWVSLNWYPMIPSEGAITGYNIYRATASGGQAFDQPLHAGILASSHRYLDEDGAFAAGTSHYYVVRPLVNGVEVAPTGGSHPTEIKIIIPPDNMALVHRWIANQETCGLMQQATDPSNHYRCNYTGPGNSGGYYDIGSGSSIGLFVDVVEAGCKYTATNSCAGAPCINRGGPGMAAPINSVYWDREGNYCYINTTGTAGGWVYSGAASASELAVMVSNKPGLPALSSISQVTAATACNQLSVAQGLVSGSKSLLTHKQQIAAAAWDPALGPTDIAKLTMGYTLLDSSGCNTKSGGGLAFDYNAIPTVRDTLTSSYDSSSRALRTGSNATYACVSRYQIQDLIGNLAEWASDQLGTCNATTHTCSGIASSVDPSNTDMIGYDFDGTIGPGGVAGVGWEEFVYGAWNVTQFLVPLGLPVVTSASSTLGALPRGDGPGYFNFAAHLDHQIFGVGIDTSSYVGAVGSFGGYSHQNEAGRYTIQFHQDGNYLDIGFRCGMAAP